MGGGNKRKKQDLPKIPDGTITRIKSAFGLLQKFLSGTAEEPMKTGSFSFPLYVFTLPQHPRDINTHSL